ncbi:MAG: hypothetical protein HY823_13230 [Acidobacteria bacterium]|nr:hypothetical protein [Acidobacteriota bacterium]
MKSLTDLKAVLLAWHPDGKAEAFELRAKEDSVARLEFLDKVNGLARIETAEGAWTLRHMGLMAPLVTLREEGSHENLAVFHPHALRHGRLQFKDGTDFHWSWLQDLRPGGVFMDPEGMPLVRIHAIRDAWRAGSRGSGLGEVELGLTPRKPWHHALLAAVGWYLLLYDQLKEQDEHAAELSLRI